MAEAIRDERGFGFSFYLDDNFTDKSRLIRAEFRRFDRDSIKFASSLQRNFTNPLNRATNAVTGFIRASAGLHTALRGMASAVPNLTGLGAVGGRGGRGSATSGQAAGTGQVVSSGPLPWSSYRAGGPLFTQQRAGGMIRPGNQGPYYMTPSQAQARYYGTNAATSFNAGGYMGPTMGSAGYGAYPSGGFVNGMPGFASSSMGRLFRRKGNAAMNMGMGAYGAMGRGVKLLNNMENPVSSAINKNFYGLMTGAGLVGAGAGVMGGLTSMGKSAGSVESQILGLTTILKSRSKANQAFSGIKEDALKTPFDIENLTQANRFLLEANNGNIGKTRKDVMGLGNAISAVGRGNDEFIRMAYNMQQVSNQGKASALDIRQFAMAGINIYGLLGDAFGKSREELQKYEITYPMITKAFEVAMSEGGRYFNGFANQMSTAEGKAQRFHESIELIRISVGDMYNEGLKPMYDIFNTGVFPKLMAYGDSGAGKQVMGKGIGLIAGGGAALGLAGVATLMTSLAPALAIMLPLAAPLLSFAMASGGMLGKATIGGGNISKWLEGSRKRGMEETTENRYGAYMMAVKDMFSTYDGDTFKISKDTTQVFGALGMGDADIEKLTIRLINLKETVKGFFDETKSQIKGIASLFGVHTEGGIAGMIGGRDSGAKLADLAFGMMKVGLAFALVASPMTRLIVAFSLFEGKLNAIGAAAPVFDALAVSATVLAFRLHPLLGLVVGVGAGLARLRDYAERSLDSSTKLNSLQRSAIKGNASINSIPGANSGFIPVPKNTPENQFKYTPDKASHFGDLMQIASKNGLISNNIASAGMPKEITVNVNLDGKTINRILVPLFEKEQVKKTN